MKIFSTLFILSSYYSYFNIYLFYQRQELKQKDLTNLLNEKINRSNNSLDIELKTIKFKVDIKNLSLFLGTNNPNIVYRNVKVPTESIKVYIDFLSIFKSTPNIKKINVSFN